MRLVHFGKGVSLIQTVSELIIKNIVAFKTEGNVEIGWLDISKDSYRHQFQY